MISAELAAKILRLYFAEHWKVGTISTQLGIHHDTVRRTIQLDQRPPPPPVFRRRSSIRTRGSSSKRSRSIRVCGAPGSSR